MSELLKTYKKITPEMLIVNDKIIIISGGCGLIDCKTCPHAATNNITGESCDAWTRARRMKCGIGHSDPSILAVEFKKAYEEANSKTVEDINE